jgi:hypothetical protein
MAVSIVAKGADDMAYETKVILTLLAQQVGKAKNLKEAYTCIIKAANVEGLELPTYEEYKKEIAELEKEN